MPQVVINDTQGMFQKTGTGVEFSSSNIACNSATLDLNGTSALIGEIFNVVTVASTPVSLTASQAGSIVLLNNANNSTTINLPAGSSLQSGAYFRFIPLNTNTNANGYIIKRGTDGEAIIGAFPVQSATDDNTLYVVNSSGDDTLTLSGANTNTKAGGVGSYINCVWDGTAWRVWGLLVSAHANPASTAVFSDT